MPAATTLLSGPTTRGCWQPVSRKRCAGRVHAQSAGYAQRHAQTWLPLARYDSARRRSCLLTFKTVVIGRSLFRVGFVFPKPALYKNEVFALRAKYLNKKWFANPPEATGRSLPPTVPTGRPQTGNMALLHTARPADPAYTAPRAHQNLVRPQQQRPSSTTPAMRHRQLEKPVSRGAKAMAEASQSGWCPAPGTEMATASCEKINYWRSTSRRQPVWTICPPRRKTT